MLSTKQLVQFGWFILLFALGMYINNAIAAYVPAYGGYIGVVVGLAVPSAIFLLLLKFAGKRAGVEVD
jgi:hypothetical protein